MFYTQIWILFLDKPLYKKLDVRTARGRPQKAYAPVAVLNVWTRIHAEFSPTDTL